MFCGACYSSAFAIKIRGRPSDHNLIECRRGVLLAETNCREAHARLVLLRPAGWALLPRRVDRFLPLITEAKLCKALACVVPRRIQALAGPACASGALARGLATARANGLACAFRGQLCRGLA